MRGLFCLVNPFQPISRRCATAQEALDTWASGCKVTGITFRLALRSQRVRSVCPRRPIASCARAAMATNSGRGNPSMNRACVAPPMHVHMSLLTRSGVQLVPARASRTSRAPRQQCRAKPRRTLPTPPPPIQRACMLRALMQMRPKLPTDLPSPRPRKSVRASPTFP